jgi:hypothetical protein
MWKLGLLTAFVSLITAVTGVLVVQVVLLNLGVPESVTNPIALVVGLAAIFLSEWQVRRWWARRN